MGHDCGGAIRRDQRSSASFGQKQVFRLGENPTVTKRGAASPCAVVITSEAKWNLASKDKVDSYNAPVETLMLQSDICCMRLPHGHQRSYVQLAPGGHPPPPCPINTVISPCTIGFDGGSGTSACGSITISPTHAAGFPLISVTPSPPPPPGVVTPGPCGAPSQASGGAFGIVQLC